MKFDHVQLGETRLSMLRVDWSASCEIVGNHLLLVYARRGTRAAERAIR